MFINVARTSKKIVDACFVSIKHRCMLIKYPRRPLQFMLVQIAVPLLFEDDSLVIRDEFVFSFDLFGINANFVSF